MNKYMRAIAANLFFFIISTVFFLAITPLALKVMGNEFYGLWAIINALMLFSNVGTLGVNTIIMKFSSERTEENQQNYYNKVMTAGYLIVTTMAILVGAILLCTENFIAANISTSLVYREQFRQALFWISLGLFPQFLSRVPQGFLLGILANRVARQIELFSSILLWSGAVIIASIDKNLVIIAINGFVVNSTSLVLYLWSIQKKGLHFRFEVDIWTIRKLINFSVWMFLENFSVTSFQYLDKIIVGIILGPTIAGVYSIGTSISGKLSVAVGQITNVMIPFASYTQSKNEQESLYKNYRFLSKIISLMTAGMGATAFFWIDEIIGLWISSEYAALYGKTFKVLIFAYCIISLSRMGHQTLIGMGHVKFTATIYLTITSIVLIALGILATKWGLIGAASANLLTVLFIVYNLYVYRIFSTSKNRKNYDFISDVGLGVGLLLLSFGCSYLGIHQMLKVLLFLIFELVIFLIFMMDKDVQRIIQNIWKGVRYV